MKVLIFGLGETRLAQATIVFEDVAALPANRLRADGREFVAPVRLVESTVCNPQSTQSIQAPKELTFAGDGADDNMGMR